jgi:hypothetical protein
MGLEGKAHASHFFLIQLSMLTLRTGYCHNRIYLCRNSSRRPPFYLLDVLHRLLQACRGVYFRRHHGQ